MADVFEVTNPPGPRDVAVGVPWTVATSVLEVSTGRERLQAPRRRRRSHDLQLGEGKTTPSAKALAGWAKARGLGSARPCDG